MTEFEMFDDFDGHRSIRVKLDETQELWTRRTQEVELERALQLMKANNDVGAMTEGMWLLLEDAYYGRGLQCNWTKWKSYLEKCGEEKKKSFS